MHANTPANIPSTPDNETVGKPHCPGYGMRNQGESLIIFNLLSDLAGWPTGRASVTVNIVQIIHMAIIVSKTCKQSKHRNLCRTRIYALKVSSFNPAKFRSRTLTWNFVRYYKTEFKETLFGLYLYDENNNLLQTEFHLIECPCHCNLLSLWD